MSVQQNKEKVIVYALGDRWKMCSDIIVDQYEVVACSDRNEKAAEYANGYTFVNPDQISNLFYEKIILGCKQRGVRENIVMQYGWQADKIFYYDEIFQDGISKREKSAKKHREYLTIVIPTYNRKKRLIRTLDILEMQSDKNFDIILLDNCSDYDVKEVLEKRESGFRDRVTIVHNKVNIGMAANLANAFIQKTEGWVWMLSDDDIPSIYAVEDIYEEIEQCSHTGIIHFSICNWFTYMKNGGRKFQSLHELMNFYRLIISDKESDEDYSGDFIFFSNKVFNMKYIQRYYEKIFFYAYSGVAQLVPILFMLSENIACMKMSNTKIVACDVADGDHWNWIQTVLGMRIITDLPLDLDEDDKKVMYRVIMGNYTNNLIANIKESNREFDIRQIEKVYDEVYQYTLSDEEKCEYHSKIKELKNSMQRKERAK